LFRVHNNIPIKGVYKDLDRLCNNLKKGLSEKDWANLAMNWHRKGLISE
jgi:hypothetical protein